jgi:hypothetical protein
MRNLSQLSFPCLESPLRFYLSVETVEGEQEEASGKQYLSVFPSRKSSNKIGLSNKPHEWCLLWTNSPTSSEELDEDCGGVKASSFVIQSVSHRVFLTSHINGDLDVCSNDYIQAHQNASTTTTNEDHGSYLWQFEYQDASGMLVHLINSTYQRRLSISATENETQACTTTPLMKDGHEITQQQAWKIHFLSGELVFLSNPTVDRRLRCNPLGKLSLIENQKGWEVFRFIECGYGELQISSWTHQQHVLCSDAEGNVRTTTDRESVDTKWTVSRHYSAEKTGVGGGVLLQSVEHGRYLCTVSENEFATVGEKEFAYCGVEWELLPANSSIFYLASTSNMLLSSRRNGQVFVDKKGKECGKWKIQPISTLKENEGDTPTVFSIYSCQHDKYLGSSEEGTVYTTETLLESAHWEIEESPNEEDGYILVSHLYPDRQLHCNDQGQLTTLEEEAQAWRFQPCMPGSISQGQMTWAGVAAATLLVAPPLSLAVGVAARAPLVAMATGGEVLTAEALALGWGTAVVGTSAAVIVADQKRRLQTKSSIKNEHPIQSINRPLIAWRSW